MGLVVTKPRMVLLINVSAVIFSVVVILNLIHNINVFFKTKQPIWSVLVWCVLVLPISLLPLCLVPMLRKEFIRMYAMGPSGSGNNKITQIIIS